MAGTEAWGREIWSWEALERVTQLDGGWARQGGEAWASEAGDLLM